MNDIIPTKIFPIPFLSDDEADALAKIRQGTDEDLSVGRTALLADAVGMEREAALVRRYGDDFNIQVADRYQRCAAALRKAAREAE